MDMKKEIVEIIRKGIIDTYNSRRESIILEHAHFYKRYIGQERTDVTAPRVTKVIEFINPKTGRVNHKTLKNQYQTYVYTQKMYDTELAKKLAKFDNDDCLIFNIQCNTDDSVRSIRVNDPFNPTVKEIETIYDAFDNRADHLIGMEIHTYNYYGGDCYIYSSTWPIFDKETMEEFNNARNKYIEEKTEFCAKYGCD